MRPSADQVLDRFEFVRVGEQFEGAGSDDEDDEAEDDDDHSEEDDDQDRHQEGFVVDTGDYQMQEEESFDLEEDEIEFA